MSQNISRLRWAAALAALGLIIAFYLWYAYLYIGLTSFTVEGERYYTLFDDAMVSMRYAMNWTDGLGLVWNPGERVEGYTNFGWTAVMALVHLLPIAQSKTSLVVQCISALAGVGCVLGVWVLGGILGLSLLARLLSCAATALYFPLTMWTLQGMETGALALLVVWAGVGFARSLQMGEARPAPFLLLGLATLFRMDALLLLFVFTAFALVKARAEWRRLLLFAVVSAAIPLAQAVWRRWYYGDWLPNTYHLKMINDPWRISRGIDFTLKALSSIGWPVIAFTLLGGCIVAGRKFLPLLAAFATMVVYQAWAGGDAWPFNRFVAPVMPFFFLVYVGTLALLADWLVRRVRPGPLRHGVDSRLQADTPPVVARSSGRRHAKSPRRRGSHKGSGNAPVRLADHGRTMQRPWVRLARVAPAAVAILLGIAVGASVFTANREHSDEWLMRAMPYCKYPNQGNAALGITLKTIATPTAKVGVFWAGAPVYFSGLVGVDFLGKSDPHIAHLHALRRDLPGHNKVDFSYSLGELKPDIVLPAGFGEESVLPAHYRKVAVYGCGQQLVFWVRKDSQAVRYRLPDAL